MSNLRFVITITKCYTFVHVQLFVLLKIKDHQPWRDSAIPRGKMYTLIIIYFFRDTKLNVPASTYTPRHSSNEFRFFAWRKILPKRKCDNNNSCVANITQRCWMTKPNRSNCVTCSFVIDRNHFLPSIESITESLVMREGINRALENLDLWIHLEF